MILKMEDLPRIAIENWKKKQDCSYQGEALNVPTAF